MWRMHLLLLIFSVSRFLFTVVLHFFKSNKYFIFIAVISSFQLFVIFFFFPGSCRQLLFCCGCTCGPPETREDDDVRNASSSVGSCERRDFGQTSKHRPIKGCLCLPNNVDCIDLCCFICEVWCKEGGHKEPSSTCCKTVAELFKIQTEMKWGITQLWKDGSITKCSDFEYSNALQLLFDWNVVFGSIKLLKIVFLTNLWFCSTNSSN